MEDNTAVSGISQQCKYDNARRADRTSETYISVLLLMCCPCIAVILLVLFHSTSFLSSLHATRTVLSSNLSYPKDFCLLQRSSLLFTPTPIDACLPVAISLIITLFSLTSECLDKSSPIIPQELFLCYFNTAVTALYNH